MRSRRGDAPKKSANVGADGHGPNSRNLVLLSWYFVALCQLASNAIAASETSFAAAHECDATDIFCHADKPMNSTVARVARPLFLFGVFLVMCMIAANTCHAKQSARNTFTLFALLGLVVILYYNIWIASLRSFPFQNADIIRHDCKQSNKGGKRANGDTRSHTINPCWCHSGATCQVRYEPEEPWVEYDGTSCPVDKYDETAPRMKHTRCREDVDGKKVYFYVPTDRDCTKGQGPVCTKEDPCTPCELDRLEEFGADRCTTCSPENSGDCHFVLGVGPYCFESPESKKATPCKRCCTEAYSAIGEIVYDSKGRCV